MGSVKTPKSPESENSYSESLEGTDGDGMPVLISLRPLGGLVDILGMKRGRFRCDE